MKKWDARVLVIAPHADDEVIGCGGLLARTGLHARVVTLTLGRIPRGSHEQTDAERRAALAVLGVECEAVLFPGKQGALDTVPMSALVSALDAIIADFEPTSVFFPYASHHQDHQATYRATLAALRPRAVSNRVQAVALYEYPYAATWPPPELPGGKFYLDLTPEELNAKWRAFDVYKSQHGHLTPDRLGDWAVMRGREVGVDAAEAFWLVRGLL
jgi:N-acetylglucosamine malate deacetylase 1